LSSGPRAKLKRRYGVELFYPDLDQKEKEKNWTVFRRPSPAVKLSHAAEGKKENLRFMNDDT